MVVTHLAEVFDQSVMQRHDEIVRAGGTVVLLRVEPARGDIGVPRQYQFAFGYHCRRRTSAARKRRREDSGRQGGRPQYRASRQRTTGAGRQRSLAITRPVWRRAPDGVRNCYMLPDRPAATPHRRLPYWP